MTTEEIVAFFARRSEAFSRHDAVALACYSCRGRRSSESQPQARIVGRSAIEKVYRLWFSAFPDLRLDIEDLLIAGRDMLVGLYEFGRLFDIVRVDSRSRLHS